VGFVPSYLNTHAKEKKKDKKERKLRNFCSWKNTLLTQTVSIISFATSLRLLGFLSQFSSNKQFSLRFVNLSIRSQGSITNYNVSKPVFSPFSRLSYEIQDLKRTGLLSFSLTLDFDKFKVCACTDSSNR